MTAPTDGMNSILVHDMRPGQRLKVTLLPSAVGAAEYIITMHRRGLLALDPRVRARLLAVTQDRAWDGDGPEARTFELAMDHYWDPEEFVQQMTGFIESMERWRRG
jgi:hypothetical protein